MLALLVTTMLCAAPQGAPAAQAAKVPEALKKAATAVTDAKGYAFDAKVEVTGGMFGRGAGQGRRRGGEEGGNAGGGAPPSGREAPPPRGGEGAAPPSGRAGPEPQELKGKFEKGKPVELQHEDQTYYKLDEQIAYQNDGKWEIHSPGQMFGRGGRGGERGAGGGGAPPNAGGGAPPRGEGGGGGQRPDFRRFAIFNTISGITLPHEVLASIDTAMTEVKSEEKDGKTIYSGPLSADVADKLSGLSHLRERMAQFGGGGGGGDDLKASGTLSITVGKDGAIEAMAIETKLTGGRFGDTSRKVDVKLSGIGSTTVDVPKEALAKFST